MTITGASLGSTTLVLTYTVAFSFALALGVETAFVATHHVARVAPFVFRWLRRR